MPASIEPIQKILIVDDRPENLLVLERVLAGCGAKLVRAESGDAALRLTLHEAFALAILDVQMPGMDGYQLADYLRGAAATRTMPIIFLTAAHSDEQHVFRGYEAGAVDFLTKPYRPEILQAKVRVFLELDRQRLALEDAVKTERDRRWLEQILLRLSDAVLVVGVDGRIQQVNQALLGLLGSDRIGIEGAPLDEVLRDADGTPALGALTAALQAGRADELELTNRELGLSRPDGGARAALVSAAPLHAEDGELGGVVLMLKDVTRMQAARDALTRSEGKYRRLFHASRDAIALAALDGTLIDANAAFERLAADEAGDRGLFELLSLPASAADGGVEGLVALIEQRDGLVRGDGSVVPIQADAWPCEGAPGDPPTLWVSLFDLTEERRRQQERILGEKMAMLGMMMGGVAHELNNPLMGIINYVDYCRGKTEPGDECHEILSDAQREAKRCVELVRNLLLVARTGEADVETPSGPVLKS